jgi:hypothetical protein
LRDFEEGQTLRRFLILSLIVPAVLAFGITSHAVPITFSYSGVVNDTDGLPDKAPFEAYLGETMYLTYTFESSTTDSNSSTNGDYLGSITAVEITVGANTYSADTGDIVITNNGENPDQYLVDIPSGLKGPSVGEIPVMRFNLGFSDFTQSVFGSDALPQVQPEPSDFSEATMWLTFDSQNFSPELEEFGTIMADGTVQAVPVPEPGTLLMLSAGLAGLIYQNRRPKSERRSKLWGR